MASKSSAEYYGSFSEMSPIRAIAETLMNTHNVRKIDIREAYEMAKKQNKICHINKSNAQPSLM